MNINITPPEWLLLALLITWILKNNKFLFAILYASISYLSYWLNPRDWDKWISHSQKYVPQRPKGFWYIVKIKLNNEKGI